jgi:hypothetical protein
MAVVDLIRWWPEATARHHNSFDDEGIVGWEPVQRRLRRGKHGSGKKKVTRRKMMKMRLAGLKIIIIITLGPLMQLLIPTKIKNTKTCKTGCQR